MEFLKESDTSFMSIVSRYQYLCFFRYQFFSKPIPILFPIPKKIETDTDTFSDTNFFRNRYRYFFRYQKFPKPIPIPSKKMEKFRNREVSKPKCHTLSVMLPILPELVMSPRCPSIHLALPSWFLPQETLTMVLAYRELEKDFGALLAFKECLDSKGAATANGKDLAF